jgi:hypothetical protein
MAVPSSRRWAADGRREAVERPRRLGTTVQQAQGATDDRIAQAGQPAAGRRVELVQAAANDLDVHQLAEPGEDPAAAGGGIALGRRDRVAAIGSPRSGRRDRSDARPDRGDHPEEPRR